MYIVYSKTDCPNCVTAKLLITRSGNSYREISIVSEASSDNEISRSDFMERYPGVRSVPYILCDLTGNVYKTLPELKESLHDVTNM